MPELRTVLTGLSLGEGPRWRDGRLWFSDILGRKVLAMRPDGAVEIRINVPQRPNGLGWLADGRLLIVSIDDRLVLRREVDGSLQTHADLSGMSPFNWNDMVTGASGNGYIGNLGFDFGGGGERRPGRLALVTPDGLARWVADDVQLPNGMVITPDGKTLVLAESFASRLTAFDIAANGDLSNRRVWAELEDESPDGICLDAENAIWFGSPRKNHAVRVAEGGKVLQTVEFDRACFAVMLGGEDRRTLFALNARMAVPGAPRPMETGQVIACDAPAPGVGWP